MQLFTVGNIRFHQAGRWLGTSWFKKLRGDPVFSTSRPTGRIGVPWVGDILQLNCDLCARGTAALPFSRPEVWEIIEGFRKRHLKNCSLHLFVTSMYAPNVVHIKNSEEHSICL